MYTKTDPRRFVSRPTCCKRRLAVNVINTRNGRTKLTTVTKKPKNRQSSEFQRKVPLFFGDTGIAFKYGVGFAEGSLCAEKQLEPCSRFDTIPACDGPQLILRYAYAFHVHRAVKKKFLQYKNVTLNFQNTPGNIQYDNAL